MPQTSALTLLPPTSVQLNPPSAASCPSDTSFQQTLDSARQRNSDKPSDTKVTDEKANTEKTDKPAARKTNKSAKSKRPIGANQHKLDPDADEDSKKQTSKDEASSALENAAAAPGEKVPAADDATHKKEKDPHDAHVDVVHLEPATPKIALQAKIDQARQNPLPVKTADAAKPSAKPAEDVTLKAKSAVAKSPLHAKAADNSTDDTDGEADSKPAKTTADPASKATAISPLDGDTTKAVGIVDAKAKQAGHSKTGDGQASPNTSAAATPSGNPAADSTVSDSSSIDEALQSVTAAIGVDASASHTAPTAAPSAAPMAPAGFAQQLQKATGPAAPSKAETPLPTPTETHFVDANHPKIITGMHGQLLPGGGTMQIRLDPPELGDLQVTVHMKDGVMTASFETSNAEATRMLSHSLNDLKTALESSGINVEKMHVQQSTKQESRGGNSDQQQQKTTEQQHEAKQEQQRREMLQRMWRKLSGTGDPLDLVA